MLSFELIPDAIEKKGIELAQSTATWETLDENKKNVLASIMIKLDGSISSREMEARSKKEYHDYIGQVAVAREAMLRHKAELNGLEISFEFYRSSNAMERARINLR
jgi:hypothetical protein